LAAPGGVVVDPAVCSEIRSAFAVWLRTSPSTLSERVQPGDHRPLLGDHPYESLNAMAATRSDLYRQVASAVVDTDDRTPQAVADIVCDLVDRRAVNA